MIGVTKITTATGNSIKEITELKLRNKNITDGMTMINGKIYNIPFKVSVEKLVITYTGAHTDRQHCMMNGKDYRLLILTGSGTLSISKAVNAEYWLCSGGNGGSTNRLTNKSGSGGGGGYFTNGSIVLQDSVICTIGSGGAEGSKGSRSSVSSFSSPRPAANLQDGASGGGAGKLMGLGEGGGQTTIPFGITQDLNQEISSPHCAGGGGGAYKSKTSGNSRSGGAGGSNGSAGGKPIKGVSERNAVAGQGGIRGGGGHDNYDANFYGSGGMGATMNASLGAPTGAGTGYQGIIYIRIPYEQ